MNSAPPFSYNYSNIYTNCNHSQSTMDTQSMCSSEISDGLSNDTFEITRRARQDRLTEGRLDRAARYNNVEPMMMDPIIDPSRHHCTASTGGRRVNFGASKIINEGGYEYITQEEMITRWWSQEDLEDIKRDAKIMSLKLRKLAKERGCYVETAHKKTSLMLTNDFQELVKMSASSPDQDLRHWTARSDGRRGLERFACRDYGNVRKDDVLGTRAAVFEEQERQRKTMVSSPELIAKVSKAKSRRSRTFSLFMGEADAQSRTPMRTKSKRTKRDISQHSSSTPVSKQQRHVASSSGAPRNFSSHDAPLLTSSA